MQKDRYELPKHDCADIDDVEFSEEQQEKNRVLSRDPCREELKQESRAAIRERTQYMNKHYKNYKK